jgi:hypothetical protein
MIDGRLQRVKPAINTNVAAKNKKMATLLEIFG